jgi:hypothetical protein
MVITSLQKDFFTREIARAAGNRFPAAVDRHVFEDKE